MIIQMSVSISNLTVCGRNHFWYTTSYIKAYTNESTNQEQNLKAGSIYPPDISAIF